MKPENNANLKLDQQCKVREIKKNVGSLSEGEIVKIMTKTSSGMCSWKRREIFGVQRYLGKELWIVMKGPAQWWDFVHIVASWAEPEGVCSSSGQWVLKSELDPELSVSWRSAASSKRCSPPWYTLYREPCHSNLARGAAPPSPAHSSTEHWVPIPGTACKSGSSLAPAPPSSSDFPPNKNNPQDHKC